MILNWRRYRMLAPLTMNTYLQVYGYFNGFVCFAYMDNKSAACFFQNVNQVFDMYNIIEWKEEHERSES